MKDILSDEKTVTMDGMPEDSFDTIFNIQHKPHASVPNTLTLSIKDKEITTRMLELNEILEQILKQTPKDIYFEVIFKGFKENINGLERELSIEIHNNELAQRNVDQLNSTISSLKFEIAKLKAAIKNNTLFDPIGIMNRVYNKLIMEYPENKCIIEEIYGKYNEFKHTITIEELLTNMIILHINDLIDRKQLDKYKVEIEYEAKQEFEQITIFIRASIKDIQDAIINKLTIINNKLTSILLKQSLLNDPTSKNFINKDKEGKTLQSVLESELKAAKVTIDQLRSRELLLEDELSKKSNNEKCELKKKEKYKKIIEYSYQNIKKKNKEIYKMVNILNGKTKKVNEMQKELYNLKKKYNTTTKRYYVIVTIFFLVIVISIWLRPAKLFLFNN